MSDHLNPVLTAPAHGIAATSDDGHDSSHDAGHAAEHADGHGDDHGPEHASGHAAGAPAAPYVFDAPMWVAGVIGVGAGLVIALCIVFAGALH